MIFQLGVRFHDAGRHRLFITHPFTVLFMDNKIYKSIHKMGNTIMTA